MHRRAEISFSRKKEVETNKEIQTLENAAVSNELSLQRYTLY